MADTENESSGPATDATDRGFPADTKIVDMTPEQQAAYWKHKARKHESNAAALKAQLDAKAAQVGNETPPTPAPKPKAESVDTAPLDVGELRKQIMADLKKEQAPELVRSQFEAIIGDRVPEATRNSLLEDLNLDNFVKEDGSVDKERIKTKAALLVPAEETPTRRVRSHQGNRRTDGKPSVESGKELYEQFSKSR